jgi:uncharacterized protein (DUF427 family)
MMVVMNNKKILNPGPGYVINQNYRVSYEVSPKRIRVIYKNEVIVDAINALILYETKHVPVYYFPRDSVDIKKLEPSNLKTNCPYKGDASYYSIIVNNYKAENAVWSYEHPFDEIAGIKDYLAFYWNKVDHWYEEDEEVFVHARSPRVRIDILDSSRKITVLINDEIIAQTVRARVLVETNHPTRYYIPREDVIAQLLPSSTTSCCPYKGKARYYSIKVGGVIYENIVWFYKDPVRESSKIDDYLCFYNEKVDRISVDHVSEIKGNSK